MSDVDLMTCGAMVHALRGNQDALRLALDTLTRDELLVAAVHGMSGLAQAVHEAGAVQLAEEIALGIQAHIYQEGTTR
ncbi:hypothetical protein HZZ00_35000 [Streptomyces sp. NEAU-sy36]|uniref:hypothetical protein n=1 Tax=unclassified Streptomyces TaxID=2593676 RepID=UPI0015D5E07E|nr:MULTISPECIES: hypothetical protein [unclassified Streptomyces]QLJ05719.1 hypothetical protein HZZ00_35000 [Streptomyces sp. NEAU-sy36]